MRITNRFTGKKTRAFVKTAALGAVLISMAGCVLEPAPPPVAYAPAPGGYYAAGPYYYPEYPPYYGYPGPSVGVGFYDGWHGGGGWRGR